MPFGISGTFNFMLVFQAEHYTSLVHLVTQVGAVLIQADVVQAAVSVSMVSITSTLFKPCTFRQNNTAVLELIFYCYT